jgi:teichuronic acid biosynthesis glycosyltransferase TuaH
MPELVIVSVTSWEGNYLKSTVELAKELSAHHRVWFLDYQYTWKDLLSGLLGINKNVPWKRMLGFTNRIRQIQVFEGGENVMIYTPWPIIPSFWVRTYGFFSWLNRVNHLMVFRPFTSMLKSKGANPVAIISALNPFMGLGVKRFFPTLPHIYYCFDEIRAAHWLKTFGGQAEEKLLPQVDAVVFTSDYLQKIKGSDLKRTTVIKNGVHVDAFAKFRRKAGTNKPPRVGYLGSIDDRFALDMMEQVIAGLPEIDFYFVGRVVWPEVPARLKHLSNVKFFSPVPAEEVPPIMGSVDIGIIPYIKNDFTRAVYPLKVNEYLGVGLAVIMTSFADLPEFDEMVEIADDADKFIGCIRKLLNEDSEEKIRARMAFAAGNSWRSRAEELSAFIFTIQ